MWVLIESSWGNTHLCIIYKQNWFLIWVPESVNRYPTASTHAAQTFEQTNRQKNIIGDHRETFAKLHSGLTIWSSEPVSCIQRFSHSLNSCSTNIWTYTKTEKKMIEDNRETFTKRRKLNKQKQPGSNYLLFAK